MLAYQTDWCTMDAVDMNIASDDFIRGIGPFLVICILPLFFASMKDFINSVRNK